MNKKIIISVLFLSIFLTISCSNKDKTGTGSIKDYAGTWILSISSDKIIIDNNGKVTFDTYTASNIKSEGAETYYLEFIDTVSGDIFIRLNFQNKTYQLGLIGDEMPFEEGTITKQP